MQTLTITDGTYVTHKSANTESVDVHLTPDTFVNVCLPDGSIVVVDPHSVRVYDQTETLEHQYDL